VAKNRNYLRTHRRALAVVWRVGDEPSQRSGLTVDKILDAAIAIADEEGLAGLSMRKVAERLAVGTMSLYKYVPGKDELVIAMVDQASGELMEVEGGAAGWREHLEGIARSFRELFRRHHRLVDVPLSRPVVGPNQMDGYEIALQGIEGIGLSDLEMNAVLELIQAHAEGMARRTVDISRDAERSGMTDDQWWFSVLPVLNTVLADKHYPLSARVGEAVGAPHTDPDEIFEFGLARILDGIEMLLASRKGSR
jgi:AcrR family transcriptional regulator